MWGLAAATLCLAGALSPGLAAPSYPLYYVFDVPPVLTGYELSKDLNRTIVYTGIIRGTLGGLPVTTGTFSYRQGASASVGGGDFTLQTAAGAVQKGSILMTSDGPRTTLLFFGTYLGTRLSFRLSGPSPAAGAALTSKGLADTGFATHAEYVATVTQAAANLPPAARDEAIRGAEGNARLVAAYQRTTGAP